jgi:hypothetical protein
MFPRPLLLGNRMTFRGQKVYNVIINNQYPRLEYPYT